MDSISALYNSLVQEPTGGDMFISTFSISSDGMTITEENSMEYDMVNGEWNYPAELDSDYSHHIALLLVKLSNARMAQLEAEFGPIL